MRIFLFVMLFLASAPAAALQIGDGQYDKTYNDLDLAATQARFNNITTKGAGGGVPVGTIIAWPVASNPEDMENWLECNGQAISASAYPELYAVVGSHTPNMTGRFLRQRGGNGGEVGTTQGDAIRNITGEFAADVGFYPRIIAEYGGRQEGAFRLTNHRQLWHTQTSGTQQGCSFDFDASRVVPVADENRPISYTVRYLIRALP